MKRGVFKRLIQYSLTALLVYFVVKAPVMLVLTEWLHLHYVLSGAISGAVLTILTWLPSELWIWRRRKNDV